ncbi:MAG: hypothetical protein ACI81W_001519 [Saprospiraceae bacterium]|jgi:hypothetical protein
MIFCLYENFSCIVSLIWIKVKRNYQGPISQRGGDGLSNEFPEALPREKRILK